MNKLIFLLSVLFISYSINQPVLAADTSTTNKCSCPMLKKHSLLEKLNLTDEQKTQIASIKAKYKEQLVANRGEYKKLISSMNGLIKSDKIDEAMLDNLANQRKDLSAERFKLKVHMKHEIYQVLTPDQQKQLEVVLQSLQQAKQ